ncbi:MAG: substrate-binding domain-containing protein [Candidatus Firestonebacteria bacterium]
MTKNKKYLLYEVLGKKLIQDIENKIFLPGQKLPPEKELCKKYKVSHLTIRRALSFLVEKKYAVRKKSVGTFVADFDNRYNNIADDFIVVILTNICLSFSSEIINAIEIEANNNGKSIILCNSNANFAKETSYLQQHIKKGIKRFIICPIGNNTSFYENLKKEHKLKIVFVDISPLSANGVIPAIKTDDIKGAYEATKYLMSIGHSKIVYIAGPKDFSSSRDRIKGYVQAIGKENSVVLDESYSVNGSYNATFRFFSNNKKTVFSAIFAFNDIAAISAKNALEDLGYKIPDDISIFGYGNFDIGKHYKLSTVNQQTDLIGKLCVETLEDHFCYDIKNLQKRLIVEPELIIRNSCKEIR